MFKNGKRHGEGVLHYASGARYEGQWEGDHKQGEGVFLFEDGTTFQGVFEADKPTAGSSPSGAMSFGPRGPHVKVSSGPECPPWNCGRAAQMAMAGPTYCRPCRP
jgi:hypothetical protein